MIELYTQEEQDNMMDELTEEIKADGLYKIHEPTEDELEEMAKEQGV